MLMLISILVFVLVMMPSTHDSKCVEFLNIVPGGIFWKKIELMSSSGELLKKKWNLTSFLGGRPPPPSLDGLFPLLESELKPDFYLDDWRRSDQALLLQHVDATLRSRWREPWPIREGLMPCGEFRESQFLEEDNARLTSLTILARQHICFILQSFS